MKNSRLWAVAGVSAAAMVFGYAAVDAARPIGAQAAATQGLKVDDFRLTSADLQSYALSPMADAKAVVIVTQTNGDPAVRAMAPDLRALKARFEGKGVEFMMLNSNPADVREAILAEANDFDFGMPVLMDRTQLVGEQLNVQRAGEVIVIDPKTWRVAYRGPVKASRGNDNWAADAVDAVIAGRAVATAERPVTGALINFPGRGHADQDAKISYVNTIAPLIEQKCVGCHQSGGIGPMELTSYEKIRGFAPMIRETIRTERMPPFHADTTITRFAHDPSLTTAQQQTLVHWIEAGAPRGEGADPLAAKTFAAVDWPLGKPDMILDIPAYTIPAQGIVEYQRPFIPYTATEGHWLRAATFKIDNRQVVHHVLTGYIANPPKSGNQASESLWGASLGTYAVGTEWAEAPKDVGTFLPPGGAIGFQNHYTPYGKQVTDHSQIGLYFYDHKPKMIMRNQTIIDPTISIPPGVERHTENAYLTFPKDAVLYSVFVHAHYRGFGSKLEMVLPDGTRKLLLAVPHYDFNWQRDYTFAEPVHVPAGAKLVATYVYNNSDRNPANPDSSRTVPWGEQSFDEMLYTTLSYRWVEETSDAPTNDDQLLLASRNIGMFDANLDDKVQMDELTGSIGARLSKAFTMLDRDGDGGLDTTELASLGAFAR